MKQKTLRVSNKNLVFFLHSASSLTKKGENLSNGPSVAGIDYYLFELAKKSTFFFAALYEAVIKTCN